MLETAQKQALGSIHFPQLMKFLMQARAGVTTVNWRQQRIVEMWQFIERAMYPLPNYTLNNAIHHHHREGNLCCLEIIKYLLLPLSDRTCGKF